jgi:hypothetical protein
VTREVASLSDLDDIRSAVADYVLSYIDGDGERMASCLHPALRKRTVADPASGELDLDEAPFDEMTGAVVAIPKSISRRFGTQVLAVTGSLASASVLSEPFLDLLHLARFDDRWLIVNALWERRPRDRTDDRGGIEVALRDYAEAYLDADPERARRSIHPDLAERRLRGYGLHLEESSSEDVIEVVTAGPEPTAPSGYTFDILEMGDGIAAASMAAAWWEFHIHLARFGERWLIVNILYRTRKEAE